VPLRMLWYFEGKLMINDISFEDRERTLEEIKTLFFYTMYLWTVAFVSPLVINYHDLLVLFSHSSLSFFFFLFFFIKGRMIIINKSNDTIGISEE